MNPSIGSRDIDPSFFHWGKHGQDCMADTSEFPSGNRDADVERNFRRFSFSPPLKWKNSSGQAWSTVSVLSYLATHQSKALKVEGFFPFSFFSYVISKGFSLFPSEAEEW